MMKKINLKDVKIKKILISILLVIALVIQFAFLSYLFKAVVPKDKNEDENVVMSYTSSGNLDYRVFLKPNEFINKEYLGSGEAYILNLIDYIELSPVYNFKSTAKTSVTGTNKLVARLKVYYKESSGGNNPEVLQREVVLDERLMSFEESQYSLGNSYKLNLDYYKGVLEDFQKEVKISMDGYVEVAYETEFSGKIGGASYKDSFASEIKIPLNKSVIEIDKISKQDKTAKVYEGDLVKTNKTVMGYIVAVNVFVFLIICLLLRKLFAFTNRNEYQRTISKLLKDYDDIIVNTNTIIDTKKYSVIEITEFKEILNLSRELLLPIMNYEVNKGSVTWFYVIKDNMLYRYIVSKNKLEKEKIKKEEESIKNKLPIDNAKKGLKDFLTKLKEKISNIIINIKSKLKKKNEVSNKDRFLNDDNEEKKDEE